MYKRRGIPLIAMIIFFALIIGIIITCIIILSTQSGKSSTSQIQFSSSNTSGNTSSNDNQVMQNAIVSNNDDGEGEEISLTDSDVYNTFKLVGNQNTFAKYAIYQKGEISEDNLSNELKLKLALSMVKDSEIEVNGNIKYISEDTVTGYLKDIFGNASNISFVDIELFNDSNFSEQYNIDRYVYNDDKKAYEIVEIGITEKDTRLINDVIEKAIRYDNKIELYVVPVFSKTFQYGSNGTVYQLFGAYNFSTKEFEDSYKFSSGEDFVVTADTFENNILLNSSTDGYSYDTLKANVGNFSSFQRYKYVFRKDSSSGKYYFESFEKAEETSDNNTTNNNNRSTNTNTNTNTNNNTNSNSNTNTINNTNSRNN